MRLPPAGFGKAAEIQLDQETGAFTAEFVVKDTSAAFLPIIGPMFVDRVGCRSL